jgi:uncharacterized protein (DUF1330 family)
MMLVVILRVRVDAQENFRAYERAAASVMAEHGGRIERSVVVPPSHGQDVFTEVHVVRFPDERALAAYRNDARLLDLASARSASVVSTEILVGEEGPEYSPP